MKYLLEDKDVDTIMDDINKFQVASTFCRDLFSTKTDEEIAEYIIDRRFYKMGGAKSISNLSEAKMKVMPRIASIRKTFGIVDHDKIEKELPVLIRKTIVSYLKKIGVTDEIKKYSGRITSMKIMEDSFLSFDPKDLDLG